MGKVESRGLTSESCSPDGGEPLAAYACQSIDNDAGSAACRVCQCAESDKLGDGALEFLGILPPLSATPKCNSQLKPNGNDSMSADVAGDVSSVKTSMKESEFVEFISPDGEVFICRADIETGSFRHEDSLIELGCSCKNDLSLVHYACALKWFVSHGSTVCEICGSIAKNVKISDLKKVVNSLKEYEILRERTSNAEPRSSGVQSNSSVDPDANAAIRRLRLAEVSLWFGPHNISTATAASYVVAEQPSNIMIEEVVPAENPATKWAVEGTGILLATGLLTVTLAWLIAPRVGKKTARSGLHILLGGICALTVVIFFRFIVLTRIKYGPARYWAILFVFWFLVFGIWASRTHAHAE